jgi:DNA gyrase inhibitor GyrI
MKHEFFSVIKGGSLSQNVRIAIKQVLEKLEGKSVKVNIELDNPKRSTPQNRYYWGVVIPYMQQGLKGIGYHFDQQKAHEFIKENTVTCLEMVAHPETGEVKKLIKSTTDLSVPEFIEWMEEIKLLAAEFLGVIIPDPNETIN